MNVDIERLVARYLRDHPDIEDLGTRVRATTPAKDTGGTDLPWVRVRMLDWRRVTRANWLKNYMVQLDVYAGVTGGQPEANLHALAVDALLEAMPGEHADGVVTKVTTSGTHLPDGDFEPARERVVITAEIVAHPLRAGAAEPDELVVA